MSVTAHAPAAAGSVPRQGDPLRPSGVRRLAQQALPATSGGSRARAGGVDEVRADLPVVLAEAAAAAGGTTTLALRAGVSRSALYAWLAGRAAPTLTQLHRLAGAAELDVLTLLAAPPTTAVGVARVRAGVSRAALARAAAVSAGAVAAAETGGPLRPDVAAKIAAALGLSVLAVLADTAGTDARTPLEAAVTLHLRTHGLTRTAMAEQLGVSRQQLEQWVSGSDPVPAGRRRALVTVLGLTREQAQALFAAQPRRIPVDAALGARLAQARRRARLSQSALATAAGFSCPSIWQWEHGYRRPSPATLHRLAQALGTTTAHLDGTTGQP